MTRYIKNILLIIVVLTAGCFKSSAQDNDKLLNLQFSDMKRFHLGFSVGLHFQDLQFTHNGFVLENGEKWVMEIPSFSPGFNVNMLVDMRLAKHFNLRFTPGIYFGNKIIHFRDMNSGDKQTQNLKSNFVVVPLELKVSAERHRNLRPYVIGGVMASFDISKKRPEPIRLKDNDFFITTGIGCDFYLPFFKFCPEVKYCFGLTDAIKHNRPDLDGDEVTLKYTKSLSKGMQHMFVISFFFE